MAPPTEEEGDHESKSPPKTPESKRKPVVDENRENGIFGDDEREEGEDSIITLPTLSKRSSSKVEKFQSFI